MVRKTLLFLFLLIAIGMFFYFKTHGGLSAFLKPKEKKVFYRKIGEIDWFTEYSFEKAFEKAKNENKLVFADFSAKWCGPCQQLKKRVFEKKEFEKVFKLAIPVYIECTSKIGTELSKRFSISGFPTVVIFDKNGKPLTSITGAHLSVDFYYDIVSLYSKGVNRENIIPMIKEKELNLKQVLYFGEGFSLSDYPLKAKVLKVAIENYRGNDRELLIEANEELVLTLFYMKQKGLIEESGLKKWLDSLPQLFSSLDKKDKEVLTLEVSCMLRQCKNVSKTFDFILKECSLKDILINYEKGFFTLLKAGMKLKKFDETNKLIEEAIEIVKKKQVSYPDRVYILQSICLSIANLCTPYCNISEKEVKKLGNYLAKLYIDFGKSPFYQDVPFLSAIMRFNKSTGELPELLESIWHEYIKKNKEKLPFYEQIIFAYINAENFEKAEKILKEQFDKQNNLSGENTRNVAIMINTIMQEFVSKEYADKYLVSLMGKVIKLDPQPEYFHTLASLYQLQGDIKNAIKNLKKAIEILKAKNASDKEIKPYLEALSELERRIKTVKEEKKN